MGQKQLDDGFAKVTGTEKTPISYGDAARIVNNAWDTMLRPVPMAGEDSLSSIFTKSFRAHVFAAQAYHDDVVKLRIAFEVLARMAFGAEVKAHATFNDNAALDINTMDMIPHEHIKIAMAPGIIARTDNQKPDLGFQKEPLHGLIRLRQNLMETGLDWRKPQTIEVQPQSRTTTWNALTNFRKHSLDNIWHARRFHRYGLID